MIEPKKITLPLDLGGYDAAYAGQTTQVWVNLPLSLRQKRRDMLRGYAKKVAAEMQKKSRATLADRVWEWIKRRRPFPSVFLWADDMHLLMAQVWSAGEDAEQHWTAAELKMLQDADPTLYAWMVHESWVMIDTWRGGKKK